MKDIAFRVLLLCSPVEIHEYFVGTCCLHLQSRRVGSGFLQHIIKFLPGYMDTHPRSLYSSFFFTMITSNLTPNLLRIVKIIVLFMLCITASPRGDIGIDRWYLAKKDWKSTANTHKTTTIKVYVSSQKLTNFWWVLNIWIFQLDLLYVLKSTSCGCSVATFGCSFLIGCSSCVTNSQSEGEKYCFFHPTQFSGPWVGTWRYVSSVF